MKENGERCCLGEIIVAFMVIWEYPIIFRCLVRRERENSLVGLGIFHPDPPKTCLSKIKRKHSERSLMGK